MDLTDPVQARVARDLNEPAFVDGVADGKWAIMSIRWPYIAFSITAGDDRLFGIRVNLEGYAAAAPAGTPWDLVGNRAATFDELPIGTRADRVFRSEWSKSNQLTPYMATERTILLPTQHEGWKSQYPTRAWNARRDIAFYLEQLHRELRTCKIPEGSQ